MPTPSSRSRTGSADSGRTGSPDCPLLLECEEEELSEAQVAHYGKRRAAFNQTMARLEELARAGATITTNPDQSVTFRTTETIGTSLGPVSAGPPLPAQPSPTGQYRFLMDPKTGRIIGSLPGQQPAGPTLPSPGIGRGGGRGRGRGRATSTIRATMRPAAPVRRTPPPSVGPVKSPQLVDLTKPGVEPVGAQPIRKAFPALSVSAKPQRAVPAAQAKRSELDARVKGLLVHTPAKFTEWLIQQGLVRSEQFEAGVKLKLGMYSDGKKFPHSGGYVWIQEGSTNKYTSVYRGSLFETGSSSNPPTVLLKMLYHWACQTNIPNVVQWVKVDNKQIDEFYQVLRAVCVAAVQDEVVGLGGQGRPVEIGVISLGTTTADGQKREVRVEVLGVLDRQNRQLRLRATEPVQGATQAERFGKIFEPLPVWLHADSKIMTDYSVDKETLLRLGFRNVSQCSLSQAGSQRPENTNQQIMEYLKKVVPKMFQNTLSNLSTPVIQQFLDELTFRELFGTMPLAAFDGMLKRITGQTAATAGMEDTMKRWLAEVAANPFADWRYSRAEQARVSRESLGRTAKSPGIKRAASQPNEENVDDLVNKKMKTAKEIVSLESYYYGSLAVEESVLSSEFKADMAFKCQVCKKVFMNNMDFMKHLHLHIETDRETAIDMADLSQCRYCYRDFDSEYKAEDHINTEHLKKGSEFVCLICNNCYTIKNHLINHMMKVHLAAEMPYVCQVCGFRHSQHREIIDHFQLNHDRTDKLQCPLCLKTYSLYGEKGYNSGNAVAYMQHLQKHEDCKNKTSTFCRRCVLRFVDDKTMKTHLAEDHASYRDFPDWEPYQYVSTDSPVQMPKPDERQMKLAEKHNWAMRSIPQQAAFAAQNLEDLALYDVQGEMCCECDKDMTKAGHYMAYLCCTKCRYSSCCSKAMSVHVQLFHSSPNPKYDLGKPLVLDKPMFCVCGFSANSGNKLAKHLGSHGCNSAYPSLEEAKKFCAERENYEVETSRDGLDDDELEKGFDPRISIIEAHNTNEKEREFRDGSVDSPESGPLAFLGLQRKDSIDEERINVEGEENEKEIDKKEDKEMETDEQADDLDEEKQSGQILFGTLFNYMKDSKDPEKASELSSADQKSKSAGSEDNDNKGMDVNPSKMLEDTSEEQNNHQD